MGEHDGSQVKERSTINLIINPTHTPPGAADHPPPHHASILSGTVAAARCCLTLVEAVRVINAVARRCAACTFKVLPCPDLS